MALTPFGSLMQTDLRRHIEEETLESYALGKLDPEREVQVEQHIFFCEACRALATREVAMARGFKVAAPQVPAEPERSRWSLRLLLPALAVCTLLITAAVMFSPLTTHRSPVSVTLFALRGDTEAHGPAGSPLVLHPDLRGLPQSSSYNVEVVKAGGASVWQRNLPSDGLATGIPVSPLHNGIYFVRVSLPSGELLREYSLVIGTGK